MTAKIKFLPQVSLLVGLPESNIIQIYKFHEIFRRDTHWDTNNLLLSIILTIIWSKCISKKIN